MTLIVAYVFRDTMTVEVVMAPIRGAASQREWHTAPDEVIIHLVRKDSPTGSAELSFTFPESYRLMAADKAQYRLAVKSSTKYSRSAGYRTVGGDYEVLPEDDHISSRGANNVWPIISLQPFA